MPASSQPNNHLRPERSAGLMLVLLWAGVNGFFLFRNGIVTTGEAQKYIGQAQLFLQTGQPGAHNLWMYFTEIALLAACLKFHLGFVPAVTFQLFFNLIATFCFYETLRSLFQSGRIAWIGACLLLLNHPYQEFNVMLQTESLFYSFTLVLSCYVLAIRKITWKNALVTTALLCIVSMTRPTGLLFIPPVAIYLSTLATRNRHVFARASLAVLGGLFFLFMVDKALGAGGEFDFMLPFRTEDIICGTPTLLNPVAIKTAANGNSVGGMLFYMTHNSGQFLRLAWLKTIAFFGLYRPYFGRVHNIYLVVFFYPLYLMAAGAFRFWAEKNGRALVYLLSTIGVTWLTVMLTCDDWHNRFFLGISPFALLLALGWLSKWEHRRGP